MYSAKTAAMNLVAELCKQRSKGNLDPFMHFLVQVMTEYQVKICAFIDSINIIAFQLDPCWDNF